MIKKFFIISAILLLTNCGYQPLFVDKDNLLLKFSEISTDGNEEINRKIISTIRINKTKDLANSYLLKINSNKEKQIAAKNSSGDVTSYKMMIIINISLINPNDNNKVVKSKEFNTSFTYNNADNKFQLSQDEKNIINNLIETVSGKIVIYLNS
jgi:outer membrane lipopolysaccharide assembly protein LptE/RlpB